jgi:hypothetical protein
MAAWLGFVPRLCSTGAKTRLLGIRSRGNRYLRTLLIERSRAVLRHAPHRPDAGSRWLIALMRRRGRNAAVVALTNEHARILWAFMTRGYGPEIWVTVLSRDRGNSLMIVVGTKEVPDVLETHIAHGSENPFHFSPAGQRQPVATALTPNATVPSEATWTAMKGAHGADA